MTLLTAWIRKTDDAYDLWIATDSRIRGYFEFDQCPKLFPIEKNIVLCFAGSTLHALPVVLQFQRLLATDLRFRKGIPDVVDLRAALIGLAEQARQSAVYSKHVDSSDRNDYRFIIAGLSEKARGYRIWHVQYQENIGRFSFR